MTKKRKRYTEQERARVLAAAEKQGLNGVQAAKKFGISTLTFYNWKKATKGSIRRDGGLRVASKDPLAGLLRSRLRDRIQHLLPTLLEEEIAASLNQVLGTRVRGRAKA